MECIICLCDVSDNDFIILECCFESNLDLKGLYSCFLLFLISRGIFLTMYLPRVFKLVKLNKV